MKRTTIKRKDLQKLIRAKYKQYKDHKNIKLGRVFHLGYLDDVGCNWSISIARDDDWEAAADFIRPYIVQLRYRYRLAK